MNNFLYSLVLCLFFIPLTIQANPIIIKKSFAWADQAINFKEAGIDYQKHTFDGAVSNEAYPSLVVAVERFDLNAFGDLQIEIINAQFEAFEKIASPDDAYLSNRIQFESAVYPSRNGYYGKISFVPITKNGNRYERLRNIELRITLSPRPLPTRRDPPTFTSVLSDGELFKIAITESGVHQLTYAFLKNELGMEVDNIDPRKIQLLGNGGGMVPAYSEAERIDDLVESHIIIKGEEDGSFDDGDYILFYAEGPHQWSYDTLPQAFNRKQNIYDDENHYIIKVGSSNGLRISNQSSITADAAYVSSSYDNYMRFEEDKSNILHDWSKTQGSGKEWYGDHFKVAREYTYTNLFSFPGLITEEPIKLKSRMILRDGDPSSFNIIAEEQSLMSNVAISVNPMSGNYDNITTYAYPALVEASFLASQENLDFTVLYERPNSGDTDSEAWLDYIQVNVRQQLSMHANQVAFRDVKAQAYPITQFNISNANSNTIIWDISNPITPKIQEGNLSASTFSFKVNSADAIKEFIAFNDQEGFLNAQAVGKITNQNIHGIDDAEFVIVYHPDFETEVVRLAEHRAAHDGINVAMVTVEQIMNEFAGGSNDPTAIRDFARMLYNRGSLKYLLLFGDGSFDQKDVYGLGKNYVPVYENHSLNPIFSFPTDDYYAILYDTKPK